MKTEHKKIGVKCDLCDKLFFSKKGFKEHHTLHTLEKIDGQVNNSSEQDIVSNATTDINNSVGINNTNEVNNTGILENSFVYFTLPPGQEYVNLSQEVDVTTSSIESDVVLPSCLDGGDLPYGFDVESFQ